MPDKLRRDPKVLALVRGFQNAANSSRPSAAEARFRFQRRSIAVYG
jgi:hypothetical protein